METFCAVIVVLLVLFLPRLMVLLSGRVAFFGMLGPVFLCYLLGFLLSFAIPDTSLAATLSEVSVPLAIPLILFSADLRSMKKLAKPALVSFALVCVSVMVMAALGFFVFRNEVAYARQVSGMLVGVYTGGTPNLIAIGMALGLDQSHILLANAADFIVGGIYFFMILSFLPRLFRRFLPAYKPVEQEEKPCEAVVRQRLVREFIPEKEKFSIKQLLEKLPAVGLAVLCVGVSLGASRLITGSFTNVVAVMLGVTTLGVAFSFVKKVRKMPGAYTTGQYFIYMFSVAMGLSFDLSIVEPSALMLLAMLCFVQFGSVILHGALARLFRIDADTAIITSTAGIYGPAFIPPVANALGNREIVLAGLLCGILGYALGNYLGIGVATLLTLF